ncbi:M23 family metallopeptidase [Pseudactinotalea sp. Z1739]|uniref:M23 family metallopeptidase n=1 Tax=Pseudactinotalea sp. Z1739 TaxID=3413028 RepID=UPI003C7BEF4C
MHTSTDGGDVLELRYPFRGRWSVRNSPANRVPSHGTTRFGTAYSIDFVPVDERGRSAPFTLTSLLRPEQPERFHGFGRAVLAPLSGRIAAVHDGEPDHMSVRGLPSIGYALTQPRRAARGFPGLAGNHLIIQPAAGGPFVALCHLRLGSIALHAGDPVLAGEQVGECGNSGNSTEPHLHLQAMTSLEAASTEAVSITFPQGLPRNGSIVDAP